MRLTLFRNLSLLPGLMIEPRHRRLGSDWTHPEVKLPRSMIPLYSSNRRGLLTDILFIVN